MIRLFTAIDIPEVNKLQIANFQDPAVNVKWNRPESFHLTLNFFGDVNVWMFRQIKKQLTQILFDPFELSFTGMDAFPDKQNPRIFWLGVQKTEPLLYLQSEIADLIFSMGVRADQGSFMPHVTIAQSSKETSGENAELVLSLAGDKTISPFIIHGFHLYASRLTAEGSVHTKVAEYLGVENDVYSP